MSRTDAHAPYWTWATWYEPCHHLYCENYISRSWQKVSKQPCNLPERPVRHANGRTRVYVPHCTWEPVWPSWREARWLHVHGVPQWYVNHVWNNPERVRVRDRLKQYCKEYNAGDDLQDWDVPCWQHRHGATWYWN